MTLCTTKSHVVTLLHDLIAPRGHADANTRLPFPVSPLLTAIASPHRHRLPSPPLPPLTAIAFPPRHRQPSPPSPPAQEQRTSAVGPVITSANSRLSAFSDGTQLWLRSGATDQLVTAGAATPAGFAESGESPAWLVYKTGGRVLAVTEEAPTEAIVISPPFDADEATVGQVT